MMRAVSYTRSTSCYPGDNEIPADVITGQNEAIRAFAKEHKWKKIVTCKRVVATI
jgi:hypothetical protein